MSDEVYEGPEKYLNVVSVRLKTEDSIKPGRKITSPADAVEFAGEYVAGFDREVFCTLNLNTKKHVVGMSIASIGCLDSATIHPRDVFKSAILSNSHSVLAIHNHPSGDCTPSTADVRLTNRLIEAGHILGIEVLDHIIVTPFGKKFFSIRTESVLDFDKYRFEKPKEAGELLWKKTDEEKNHMTVRDEPSERSGKKYNKER